MTEISPEQSTTPTTTPVDPIEARSYQRIKLTMSIISMALNVAVPLVFLLAGGSEAIRNLVEGWTGASALIVVFYLLVVGIGFQIIEFPFEIYSGFLIEKKFGLSKVTIVSWLYDWLKGTLLQSVLLVALISGMYWLLRSQPDLWWLSAAIGATVLVIILMALVPVLLLPLFYKFEPIPEGELKDRLFALADKIGTHVQGVYVWHLGDKTSKANAAVTGWGRTRRIIISDTLIESNTIEEIEVVMAHELGHHVRWDVWKMLAVSTVLIFISFFVIDLALVVWIDSLGLRGIDDIAGLPLVLIVGAGVSLIALPISNWLSRKAETAADLYALNLTGMRDEFISAMNKLGDQNLSDKKPNAIVEFIFHSHPSIQHRIDNANAWSPTNNSQDQRVSMPDTTFTPKTTVSIDGDNFLIDGIPTHQGRSFRGTSIEGLMMNSRMANAMWDDENEFTRHLWAYSENDRWRADRNTDELIDMLPTYKSKGLDCIDINLQGASPLGYYRSDEAGLADLMQRIHAVHPDATEEQIWAGVPNNESQPWISGAFTGSGDLKPAFMDRTARIIEAADALGMVICLGYFYFGQDERLVDEDAVKAAVDNATRWVLEKGYTNVIIEINNEADVPRYEHEILCPPRIHELIERASKIELNGKRLLISTSFTRRMVPTDAVIAASDYILLHGNGMDDTAQLTKRVIDTRASESYRGQPIFFNEDDHFDFENESNNFAAALEQRAGWGYFDPGPGAGGGAAYGDYEVGYQNPPINWTINTQRKESFFWFLNEVTNG